MKNILLATFLLISSGPIFGFGDLMRSNRLSKSCTGANYATSGTQSSTNFGVSYGSCSGFSCSGGYTVSGSTCIAVATGNTVCGDSGLGLQCVMHPSASSLNNGSLFAAEFDIMGSCTTQGWITVRKKYNCANLNFGAVMNRFTQGANSCGGAPSPGISTDEATMNANCTTVF